jgi:hypothetical protein
MSLFSGEFRRRKFLAYGTLFSWLTRAIRAVGLTLRINERHASVNNANRRRSSGSFQANWQRNRAMKVWAINELPPEN